MLESGMYHDSNPKGLFHTSRSKGINDQYMCPGGSMAQLNACGGGREAGKEYSDIRIQDRSPLFPILGMILQFIGNIRKTRVFLIKKI